MPNRSTRAASAALLFVALSPFASASVPVQRGVVADDAHAQILLMRPEGGIEAIDAASGRTRWTSAAGDLPLFVDANRVVALRDAPERGVLALAVLDASSGATIAQPYAEIPAPARALVDERLGERFEIVPEAGTGRFAWSYTLETVPGAVLTDANRVVGSGETDLDSAAARGRIVLSGVVAVDAGTAATTVTVDARPAAVGLRSVETRDHAGLGGRRFLSPDATHVLASERSGPERYEWRVHARNGAALGAVETPYAHAPFAVLGETLVYTTPLRLDRTGAGVAISPVGVDAVDLKSGRTLWRRELRDTTYRGPWPP